eukprot:Amastigsp_a339721_97.p2 type:complete len:242 gc:universal Amastigsp_a339721_97:953-228(-)
MAARARRRSKRSVPPTGTQSEPSSARCSSLFSQTAESRTLTTSSGVSTTPAPMASCPPRPCSSFPRSLPTSRTRWRCKISWRPSILPLRVCTMSSDPWRFARICSSIFTPGSRCTPISATCSRTRTRWKSSRWSRARSASGEPRMSTPAQVPRRAASRIRSASGIGAISRTTASRSVPRPTPSRSLHQRSTSRAATGSRVLEDVVGDSRGDRSRRHRRATQRAGHEPVGSRREPVRADARL